MSEPSSDPELDVDAGFSRVDDQPQAEMLVRGMEATARWPAVQRLRAWERDHLQLAPGQRLLDVGCGIGDASAGLSPDLVPGGVIVAIDASEAMLTAARARSSSAFVPVLFHVGDACALAEDDRSYDAVRCERVLQ